MDPVHFLRLLFRNWLLVLISVIIGVAAAVLVTANTPPKYVATITMLAKSTKVYIFGAVMPPSLQQVKSYANLLSSRRMISQIVDTEDEIAVLQQNITAQVIPDTLLLQATISDGDPVRAKQIADALGAKFPKLVDEMERLTAKESSGIKVVVVDQPRVSSVPVSPKPLVNVAYGALIALFVGIGSILLRDRLDTTVKTSEMLQRLSQSYTLGIIGYDKAARGRLLIAGDRASSSRSEAYRSLSASLQFIDIDRQRKSLVITSCLPHDGKSSTAANLAIALAQAGRRVVVVDGNLRRPRIRDYFGIDGAVGLTDVLLGNAPLGAAIHQWGDLDPHVLPSGQIPPNPSELLGSRRMGHVLDELTKSYDMVIIDAPPLPVGTDAATLAAACDGAILVVRYGKTRQEHVIHAKELLSSVDARMVGTVLNAVPAKARRYDHGYGHGAESQIKREVTVPVSG
ncbi:polysaccharide biosynthesis tyrosine autokinase [Nonomuraea polychroma]|uniref:polysaccharide biosynthesis tyrosine autokinase n=1 Tax=Nonomuraea polychroma TaxID=46176 RepID=UPI003D8E3884